MREYRVSTTKQLPESSRSDYRELAYTVTLPVIVSLNELMSRTLSLTVLFLSFVCDSSLAGDGSPRNQADRWEASSEKKYTIKLEASPPAHYCKSNTAIEYYQDDTVAKVNGEIKIDGCIKASGKYTISVRYRDDAGDTHNIDFDETWQRSSADPITISHAYPMADNVDLVRVRARRSRCVCNDAAAKEIEQEESPPTEPR